MRQFKHLSTNESNAIKWFVTTLKNQLNDQLLEVQLFGSKVRGDFQPDSDIDLLVIVKERSETILDQVAEILLQVELKYDPQLSVILFSEHEYRQNQIWETPFIKNVQREGILLS